MDGVFLVATALAAGALALPQPNRVAGCGILAALLALSVALLWVRRRRLVAFVVVVAAAVGALRGTHLVAEHARLAAAAPHAAAGKSRLMACTGEGTIDASPTQHAASTRLVLDAVRLSCDASALAQGSLFAAEPRPLDGRVTLFFEGAAEASSASTLGRGDRVAFVASLGPPQRFDVPELEDDRPSRARGRVVLSGGAADVLRVREGRGVAKTIDRVRAHVRKRIQATFPPSAEGLARALVLGESDLSDDDARDFRDSGLSHLLAVSGMHLVVAVNGLVAVVLAVLARIRWVALRVVPRRAASVVGLVFCWIYCDFSGSSGSAVRAACMLSVQLVAVASGRRARPLRTLGWSVALVALVDPLAAHDVSFLLSAAATFGLVALGGSLSATLGSRGPSVVRGIGKSLATTLAATIPCAPVLLRMGPAISLGGLFANLVAVPVGELAALPICLGHSLLAPFPSAERGAALAGGGALLVVRSMAHATASSRLGRLALPRPTDLELGLVAAFVIVVAFARSDDPETDEARLWIPRGRATRVALVGIGLLFACAEARARALGRPRGQLRVSFLDVGQGDAALVDLPNGEAILIDAGGLVGSAVDPGQRVIGPLLRARRRDALRAVIVSHPHPDHFLGLAAALEGIRVDEVWDTGEIEASAGPPEDAKPSPFGPHVYAATLRELRKRGATVRRPSDLCGRHDVGGAEIEVLAPCPGFSSERGTNDNSLVLRVRFGATRVLFVGDAERATEADLVRTKRDLLRADVLKVGHHGSRTSSTPAFLAAVSPRVAVMSCGVRNRYGHPHPETLASFGALPSARLFRTDCHGTVVLTTDGRDLTIEPAKPSCAP